MSKGTLETIVRGYKVEIDYDYTPPCRGERERGTGLQLSPDEEADVEILGVRLVDANDFWEIITEEALPTEDEIIEAFWKYEEEYDPT